MRINIYQFSSGQLLSFVWLCDPMDYSMPGFPVLHYLPEFAQTHVHWVKDSDPTILFHVSPFSSHLQSFLAPRSFQMNQFFASGGQSVGVSASASVIPMNIQNWFPSENYTWVSEWVKSLSRVQIFVILWTVAYQAPLSMGLSRQEYWSGLPFPSPVDLPHPGIKPGSPALDADTLTSEPPIIPTSALLTMLKPLTMWITINCGKFLKRWEYQITWPASWETSMQVRKQQLELDTEQ